MPVRIDVAGGVVLVIGVEVEGLGVLQLGVGDGGGGLGPVGGEETAEEGVVVAGAETSCRSNHTGPMTDM